MAVFKAVIHTDVFLDHLLGRQEPSVLRQALQKFFCYTTVFQAVDLFSMGRSARELQVISDAMAAMKVLGLNAKNARRYGEFVRQRGSKNRWNSMIAGLCLESRLPIITGQGKEFRGIPGLTIIPSHLIVERKTADEIHRTLQPTGQVNRVFAG